MDENPALENISELCRICASKIDLSTGINIFESEVNEKQIYERINSCLPIKVLETDQLPKIICAECEFKLELCFTFRNKSLETEQYLLKFTNPNKNEQSKMIIEDSTIPNATNGANKLKSNEKLEQKTQHTDDSDDDEMMEMDENDKETESPIKEQEFVPLNSIKTEPFESEDTIQYFCDMCSHVSYSEDDYVNHYEEHLNKCVECEMVFPNNKELQAHRNKVHSDQKEKTSKRNESGGEDSNSDESSDNDGDIVAEDGELGEEDVRKCSSTKLTENRNKNKEATNSPISSKFIPENTSQQFEKTYLHFKEWCDKKKIKKITENVILTYLEEMSTNVKSSTLWSIYTMLKSMLYKKEKINIKQFPRLLPYLKDKSIGFQAKKSMIFTKEQIDKFLREASDEIYLMRKLVLIMGVCGACKRDELVNMSIDDIEDQGSGLIIKVPDPGTNTQRTFIIAEPDYIELYRKYVALRPGNAINRRFFLKYASGKCVNQVVGINKIGAIPSEIAHYLDLPNPDSYTGHCYRQTAANLYK